MCDDFSSRFWACGWPCATGTRRIHGRTRAPSYSRPNFAMQQTHFQTHWYTSYDTHVEARFNIHTQSHTHPQRQNGRAHSAPDIAEEQNAHRHQRLRNRRDRFRAEAGSVLVHERVISPTDRWDLFGLDLSTRFPDCSLISWRDIFACAPPHTHTNGLFVHHPNF